MGIGGDVAGDLGEVQVHGLGLTCGRTRAAVFVGLGAGGGKQIGGLVALIARLSRYSATI